MKRTVKPFVVERKRRAASAGDGPPSIWSKADGKAFREQATDDSHEDAPAPPSAPRPVAHAAAEPRILPAKAAEPAPDPPAPIAKKLSRPARLTERQLGPEGEIGGRTEKPRAIPRPAIKEPAATVQAAAAPAPQAPPVASDRMSAQRAKRKAARQQLPLHERWKWDLLV